MCSAGKWRKPAPENTRKCFFFAILPSKVWGWTKSLPLLKLFRFAFLHQEKNHFPKKKTFKFEYLLRRKFFLFLLLNRVNFFLLLFELFHISTLGKMSRVFRRLAFPPGRVKFFGENKYDVWFRLFYLHFTSFEKVNWVWFELLRRETFAVEIEPI